MGYPIAGLRSKSWDEFERPDAPRMDFVITVCDNAAGEVCPIWPGHPIRAHWGIEDPASIDGSSIQKLTAFATAFRHLRNRICLFTALPIAKLQASLMHDKMREIGRSEGASAGTSSS
jgi:arsenate reductase (thioredoxin)